MILAFIFFGLLDCFLVVRGNHNLYAFLRIEQNVKNLRIDLTVQSFHDNKIFGSKTVFDFSFNVVECVSGCVFRK